MSINGGAAFLRRHFEESQDEWTTRELATQFKQYYAGTDSIRIALKRLSEEGLIVHVTPTTWKSTGAKSALHFQKVETPKIEHAPAPQVRNDPKEFAKAFDGAVQEIITRHREEKPRKPVSLAPENATALIVLSDIHHGEIVPGEYDMGISSAYLEGIIDKAISLIGRENTKKTIDEIVIALNGDIIDGDCVFDGQWNTIQDCAFGQYINIMPLLLRLISQIKNNYKYVKNIRVYAAPGNHGKVSANGTAKPNNWDFIIYETLRSTLSESHPDVVVQYNPQSEFVNFEIRGHRFMMKHWCPRYLATPAGQKKLSIWKSKHKFNAAIFSHWHTSEKLDYDACPIFRNGAPVPPNEYADSLALNSKPAQWLLGITEEHLPSFMYEMTFKKEAE